MCSDTRGYCGAHKWLMLNLNYKLCQTGLTFLHLMQQHLQIFDAAIGACILYKAHIFKALHVLF